MQNAMSTASFLPQKRDRLSKSPVGELLTLSVDVSLYDCENFLLEGAIQRYPFPHWLSHLLPLHAKMSNDFKEKGFQALDAFGELTNVLTSSLERAGYVAFARELRTCPDEASLNATIIRQYTEESNLYADVNRLLRRGHAGGDVSTSPLVPWICQLAVALRRVPEYLGHSYRGTTMDPRDVREYQVGGIFVWAPFTSASRTPDACFGGNVIFELIPVSALSERDKRAPRDIGAYSVFPDEEEVLLPMCCAFRPRNISQRSGVTWIETEILDHW